VSPAHRDAWECAREVAQSLRPAGTWRQELADALELAVRPDAVGFFMCALGNVLDASMAMAPSRCEELGRRLVEEFFPRALRAGGLTPWAAFGSAPDAGDQEISRAVRRDLLEPLGFHGMIAKVLRAETGALVGWVTVFCRGDAEARASEIAEPLNEVCRIAGETVRRSLSIAASAGARPPQISAVMLSEREREVVRLAISGLSDLNIGQRLAISEGTVGRHMHSIFRKLGVTSRLELRDLLGRRD
jgi:DNA-binding CsgD family transcriptional regulator